MLRIGEVAKKYQISNRTLRYWEDEGILTSTRLDNGYRYYDDVNINRVRQITLLRKLNLPISDIEKIFLSSSKLETSNILKSYQNTLRAETSVNHYIDEAIDKLIKILNGDKSIDSIFDYLDYYNEPQVSEQISRQDVASNNDLLERLRQMSKLDHVRIVKLPAMIVASYQAFSATPENDCAKNVDPFVIGNKIHESSGFRSFGFNNPDPIEGKPEYGYEMWFTYPDGLDIPSIFTIKKFEGGLFASISTTLNEIGERWEALYNWNTDSEKYIGDFDRQWLEEISMDYEQFNVVSDAEKQLDLLLPIKER